ncbi:BCCT family transporter [Tessaracoccus rhinocerotis]|uniref:BCCT family transporter n=2 Tax=Tessaracoccus rhinocerotis TaxID=1689449 RepID=A0A553K114_9ACTN|nr:BCCT family transporter [Tessaracoccus rhinocerotis]
MVDKPPEDRPHKGIEPVRDLVREVTHPALIPGVGVEDTGREFRTNWTVIAVAGIAVVAVVVWGFVSPATISEIGVNARNWTTKNFGWLFSLLAVVTLTFMLVVGYGRTGGVRLGADDEQPEFSTAAWVAMLFSAGMGIGLLFWGPSEPLVYFVDVPYGFDAEPGTRDAMLAALAQAILHWGPMAWGFYALVGGAIAYAAYRRGRAPLISAIFHPIFKERTEGWIGSIIDTFAIIVTLFGTAVTLGMGALQVAAGVEVVSGLGPLGNSALVVIITVLTAAFVVSAVSGIKRGIRLLSNINMVVAGGIGLLVFIGGPTLFLLNMVPASVASFFGELGMMLARNPGQGEAAAAFMAGWTNYYWAWWISWTPFVGMFIAKISRGRTLREFVTVVIIVPSVVCIVWFGIMGGTTMLYDQQSDGGISAVRAADGNEGVLFAVFEALQSNLVIGGFQVPIAGVLSVAAMISIILFFVTSADSASIVMGSMSQRGRPEPATSITIMWGLLLGAAAMALLLAGGEEALSGLQAIMIVTALPFALIVCGVLLSWAKELRHDPYMLRHRFARAAIAQGVRRGIEEHGDDFVFNSMEVGPDEGAGAGIDTDDPALTEWWDAATGLSEEETHVTAADVTRTLEPGHIQRPGPPNPRHTASGDASLTVGEGRRPHPNTGTDPRTDTQPRD